LGLLPRQNDCFSNRTKRINALIAPLDDGETVRFLDLSDRFQTEVGQVKPELYGPDQLHLVKAGYQVWADAMQPLFDPMMK
jgi:beta-glucosidase